MKIKEGINFKNWIKYENIDLYLFAESELETITKMLELAAGNLAILNIKGVARDLYDQEFLAPSPTGNCAVIFRVISESVSKPQLFFGRFNGGIGYYSRRGNPIDLIFLIVSPPKNKKEFLKIIDILENKMNQVSAREKLRSVQSKEEALNIISEYISGIELL